jgi:hypothetical protein
VARRSKKSEPEPVIEEPGSDEPPESLVARAEALIAAGSESSWKAKGLLDEAARRSTDPTTVLALLDKSFPLTKTQAERLAALAVTPGSSLDPVAKLEVLRRLEGFRDPRFAASLARLALVSARERSDKLHEIVARVLPFLSRPEAASLAELLEVLRANRVSSETVRLVESALAEIDSKPVSATVLRPGEHACESCGGPAEVACRRCGHFACKACVTAAEQRSEADESDMDSLDDLDLCEWHKVVLNAPAPTRVRCSPAEFAHPITLNGEWTRVGSVGVDAGMVGAVAIGGGGRVRCSTGIGDGTFPIFARDPGKPDQVELRVAFRDDQREGRGRPFVVGTAVSKSGYFVVTDPVVLADDVSVREARLVLGSGLVAAIEDVVEPTGRARSEGVVVRAGAVVAAVRGKPGEPDDLLLTFSRLGAQHERPEIAPEADHELRGGRDGARWTERRGSR